MVILLLVYMKVCNSDTDSKLSVGCMMAECIDIGNRLLVVRRLACTFDIESMLMVYMKVCKSGNRLLPVAGNR